jgi:hypothetical protein
MLDREDTYHPQGPRLRAIGQLPAPSIPSYIPTYNTVTLAGSRDAKLLPLVMALGGSYRDVHEITSHRAGEILLSHAVSVLYRTVPWESADKSQMNNPRLSEDPSRLPAPQSLL